MVYTLYFDREYDTINGRLSIRDSEGGYVVEKIAARSGQVGWTDTSWVRSKSPCPYGRYSLHLKPNNRGQKAGLRGVGEFFPIDSIGDRYTTFNVARTLVREELGLHEENGFPGSAGCIVIVDPDEWKIVSSFLRNLSLEQTTIPVIIL